MTMWQGYAFCQSKRVSVEVRRLDQPADLDIRDSSFDPIAQFQFIQDSDHVVPAHQLVFPETLNLIP
jgi:hypothetical protein